LGGGAVERLFEDRERSSLDDSFAIHRRGEAEPLGVVSLMNISEANLSADLSVIVGGEADRHEGHGTEAIGLLLDYAFAERGLNRVGLSVFEYNEPARAAYQKLGFKPEGRLRGALHRDGAFHDAILMSVLADEWPGA
jgi:RimJ/RimL family protein N-acetyltransferase